MAGQALALTVDDAGRVYLSCTARAFGRGALSIESGDRRRRDDRSVFSLEDRRSCVERWLRDGELKPAEAAGLTANTESVVCFLDTGNDGIADQRVVVAQGFRDMLDGPSGGIAVLAGGGIVFGCTPSLWRLEDDTSDLRADRQLPLLTGFGIRTGNGLPGIRALTEGPDGMIYFTTTDRGCRVQSPEGPRFVIEDSGAVFRCRAGGEDLELLATGLRDPAGIAVDLRGRIFVADAAPDGQSSRLLYVLPGADFGWDAGIPERGVFAPGKRPPWMLPELGILNGRAAGLVIAPALMASAAFPGFIMADGRSSGGLVPVALTENAGGLTAIPAPPLWQGGAASGVAAGPDGALYWSDWGAGLAAASACRICRLPARDESPAWREGAGLLAAGLTSLSAKELTGLLEHAHPQVRLRARQALTARGFQESLDVLSRTARRSPSLQSRLNAVWGMAALAQADPMLLNEILLLFASAEPDIRALALRIIGDSSYDGPPQALLPLLRDPSPDVRVEAAIAIGRLRPAGCAESLSTALHASGEGDPFLCHALTYALARVFTPATLAAHGRASTSPHVKMAALHGLRRQHAAETADFLDDEDPDIIAAAADTIYDGMILPGYPSLAAVLEKCATVPQFVQPGLVRRALAAALRTGTAAEANAVAAFAALPPDKLPADLRMAAIETLAGWDMPPAMEPVHGRHDPPLPRPEGIARPLLLKLLPDPPTFTAEPFAGRIRSLTAAAHAQTSVEQLISMIGEKALSDAARVDALQQLAARQPSKALEISRSLLPGGGTAMLRANARITVMKLDPASSYAQVHEALAAGSPPEMQAVLQLADRFDSKQSEAFWLDLAKKYFDRTIDPCVQLEVLEGLTRRDTATRSKMRRLLEAADANLDEAADPLARWRLCETGGDPDKGRRLFESGRFVCCTSCHSLNGRGGTDGPELDGAGTRLNRADLLAAIIHPSDKITPGYAHVTVTMQDGTRAAGLLRQRDDTSLLLATRTGPRRINADVVQTISEPVSLMPPAGTLLTPREIRDLVAWLVTLK